MENCIRHIFVVVLQRKVFLLKVAVLAVSVACVNFTFRKFDAFGIGSHIIVSHFVIRIPTVKFKIPGKAFLKSESRASVTFKL